MRPRDDSGPSNTIRYGVITECYRISSNIVEIGRLGARALGPAAKTRYELAYVTLHHDAQTSRAACTVKFCNTAVFENFLLLDNRKTMTVLNRDLVNAC